MYSKHWSILFTFQASGAIRTAALSTSFSVLPLDTSAYFKCSIEQAVLLAQDKYSNRAIVLKQRKEFADVCIRNMLYDTGCYKIGH